MTIDIEQCDVKKKTNKLRMTTVTVQNM